MTVAGTVIAVAGLALLTGCKDLDRAVAPGQDRASLSASGSPAPSLPGTAPQSSAPATVDPDLAGGGPVPSSASTPAPLDRSTALRQLDALAVKGRAPKTGYDRDEFGQAWSDDVAVTYGRNGCDTRNDILKRDLRRIEYKGSSHCVIASGILSDPYTGATIEFRRGQQTSSAVQIDHVVALADAWQKGAQQWSADKRRDFANDPRNLLAVDGPSNQQKSAGDAATWLPANKAYRCTYASKQVQVKSLYGLWVTQAEKDALAGILAGCPA